MRQRSIERAATFRISYRRAEVIGFWLVIVTLAAVGASLIAVLAGAQEPWIWPLLTAGVLLAPGLFRRDWFDAGVWFWNGCARRIAAGLRWWILTTTYFLLITVVGRAGSRMGDQPRGSNWRAVPPNPGNAAADVLALCTRGQLWALALLPVIRLLALLSEDEQDSLPPSTTYTLY